MPPRPTVNCGIDNTKPGLTSKRAAMTPPPWPQRRDHLPGRWLWGGVLMDHFGHFLTESTPRLWAIGALKDQLDGLVFLHKRNGEVANLHRTFMALMAERGNRRLAPAFNVVALLPIITPPFVVGLGLILLFGRAGLVNQFLEYAFDITPSRWFYGWFGVWVAQTFAFTPVAFMKGMVGKFFYPFGITVVAAERLSRIGPIIAAITSSTIILIDRLRPLIAP